MHEISFTDKFLTLRFLDFFPLALETSLYRLYASPLTLHIIVYKMTEPDVLSFIVKTIQEISSCVYSPQIFLLGTHLDECTPEKVEFLCNELKEKTVKFTSIKKMLFCSLKSKDDVANLADHLCDLFSRSPVCFFFLFFSFLFFSSSLFFSSPKLLLQIF